MNKLIYRSSCPFHLKKQALSPLSRQFNGGKQKAWTMCYRNKSKVSDNVEVGGNMHLSEIQKVASESKEGGGG